MVSELVPAFERDPYRRELEVKVIEVGSDRGGRAWVLLDDTLLYPEGGGQPCDHGWLDESSIVDVQRFDDHLRHFLTAPMARGPARLTLDWPRRHDHMQQHTAQHLLTALALDRFGWATTAFHLGAEVSSIDLAIRPPGVDELDALERAALEEIAGKRRVQARRVSREDFERLHEAGEIRSRRLPSGHKGAVRLVEIEGLDVNTCGGTHLASLAEIATLKLLGAEPAHGGCRLFWVAGDRVRRRLAVGERCIGELRRLFETSADELPTVARLKLEQLRRTERRVRGLEERYAVAVAESLAAADGTPEVHLEDADGGFLQKVARAFTGRDGAGLALLTASGDRGEFFAVAAGNDCPIDVSVAGRAVAEILDGRGGGSGRLFQGKAGSLSRRGEAVRVVSEAVAESVAEDG